MKVLKFVFGHRGPANLVKRTLQIARRFGHGPERMGGRFERFMDVLDEFACRPTFPITALPMSRNPSFAHRLVDRGAELAVHAWSHIDLATLDYDGQSDHMGRAVHLFREHAVPFTGFRAPYLHWNDDTMRVVETYRFRYSSNQTIWWDVIDTDALTPEQMAGLEKGIAFYNPIPASQMRALPFRRRGFVEIPVSLPDDEIPLDRMYMHDVTFLGQMWKSIFEKTYTRGELFTLQLHPERIDFFTSALRELLGAARMKKPTVWVATLDDIAEWWAEKTANHAEFVRDGDRFRADISACPGTTVFVREKGGDSSRERAVDPGPLVIDGDVRPCVAVAPGSSREALQALADLGYIVEVGSENDPYAVHLGVVADSNYDTIDACKKRIAAASGPLVRFGVWPRGNHSALAVTGDIDALTIWDFVHRFRGA